MLESVPTPNRPPRASHAAPVEDPVAEARLGDWAQARDRAAAGKRRRLHGGHVSGMNQAPAPVHRLRWPAATPPGARRGMASTSSTSAVCSASMDVHRGPRRERRGEGDALRGPPPAASGSRPRCARPGIEGAHRRVPRPRTEPWRSAPANVREAELRGRAGDWPPQPPCR